MFTSPYLKSNYLLFTGLLLLVAGLPVSLFLTSLAQFFLAGSLFLEGNLVEKLRRLSKNKAALLLAGIWFMHVVGLLWTSDLHEGFKDVRIKLPLLILPVVLAGSGPLSAKQFRLVLAAFIFGVFAGTMVSMAVMAGIIHRTVYDIRDIFIFHISHIRFSLFTCLGIFILTWFLSDKESNFSKSLKAGMILLALWFLVFLVIVESVTGIVILLLTALIVVLYREFTRGTLRTRVLLAVAIILLPLAFFFTAQDLLKDFYKRNPYPIDTTEKTKLGNPYKFYIENQKYENGYPVFVYISWEELEQSWKTRSKLPFDSMDERHQPVKFTLVRFLSSKGFRKDAEAVSQLSNEEISSIEKGVTNVKYQELSGLRARLVQIVWEFDYLEKGGNPSGHSVTQRFEFWRAAWGIIQEHPLFGLGTGDMPVEYKKQYKKMNTQLSEPYRLRAHNQYLALAVAFGFIGLAYFVFVLGYVVWKNKMYRDFLFISFWLIAIFSMFTEDTLETQPGSTFIALFASLFLFSREKKQEIEINDVGWDNNRKI